MNLETCYTCGGSGEIHSHNPKCYACNGSGQATKERNDEEKRLEVCIENSFRKTTWDYE